MKQGAELGCHDVEARLADYLAGSLSGDEIAALERHGAGCERCGRELESLGRIWEGLGRVAGEEPGASARMRFDAMLSGYLEAEARARRPLLERLAERWRRGWPASPAWQAGLIVAALLVGVVLGGRFGPSGASSELSELRAEVAGLSRLVGMSLLEGDSASDRLRGVSYSRRSAAGDPEILEVLLEVLKDDPDVNVRLAALDVLAAFVDRESVAGGLRSALAPRDAPLVQVALVDVLLAADGRESRAAVQGLLDEEALDETVREFVTSRLASEV